MAPRSFMPMFAIVSAGVLAIVATTGCAWLLFGPCGMYGCPRTYVTSLPPRDNPLALALSTPMDQERVESTLSAVVKAQSGVPANTPCAEAAVPGCRYSILLQMKRYNVTAPGAQVWCSLLAVVVEARARIRPLIYHPAACPDAIPSNHPAE